MVVIQSRRAQDVDFLAANPRFPNADSRSDVFLMAGKRRVLLGRSTQTICRLSDRLPKMEVVRKARILNHAPATDLKLSFRRVEFVALPSTPQRRVSDAT